jgi:hypothetical protein
VRAGVLGPALVEVADQEVGASGVAELADLAQELPDRDAGLFCPPLAGVVAVGIDEGDPVVRRAQQPRGPVRTIVALDRVQRQAGPASAVQQADAVVAQVVDLLPALQVRLGPLALGAGSRRRPAGRVRRWMPALPADSYTKTPAITLSTRPECLPFLPITW